MECCDAITTTHTDAREGIISCCIVGLSIPRIRITSGDRKLCVQDIADGEIQGNSAIASMLCLGLEVIDARLGIRLSIPDEGITSSMGHGNIDRRKHREIERDDGIATVDILRAISIDTALIVGLAIPDIIIATLLRKVELVGAIYAKI